MAATPIQEILGPPPPGSDFRTKILWYAADAVATGILINLFDYGQPINTAAAEAGDPDATNWLHCQVVFEDLNSQDVADDQIFTLDVLKVDNIFNGAEWDDSSMTQLGTLIGAFVTSIAAATDPRYRAKEIRMYRRAFLPRENPKPFTDAGGPAKVFTLNFACTGVGSMPPSVTSTITRITPSRKHWGRMYMPTPAHAHVDANGRLTSAYRSMAIAAAPALAEDMADFGMRWVVPTTSSGGVFDPTVEGDWTTVVQRTLQQVNAFRIDDVIDSHRSRRHKHALAKNTSS